MRNETAIHQSPQQSVFYFRLFFIFLQARVEEEGLKLIPVCTGSKLREDVPEKYISVEEYARLVNIPFAVMAAKGGSNVFIGHQWVDLISSLVALSYFSY